ncbi:hypothetical protein [uncultured Dubosiella sp.]|uniref:hypothetical protein n=1 Tax=uncultured Dubosiella sp. TaxID=1937011 RepID=UPI0025B57E49|nr:hypothetical protein [uncultured Dubosiella sp.]
MKDGYYAQNSASDTQVQDLLKILTEQIEKQSEQIEKLYDIIEERHIHGVENEWQKLARKKCRRL